MSLPQEIAALYQTMVNPTMVRYAIHPAGASTAAVSDGAAAANAWSAYVQIVAAAVIPNPCWITGIFLHLPVVEAFYGDFAIASGALAAEVDLVLVPFDEQLFAVVEGKSYFASLAYPVKVEGSPRLAVRVRKNTAASAAGASLRVQIATGIGQ